MTDPDAVRRFLAERLASKEPDIAFFVGAGISAPAPASLPLADQIIATIASVLDGDCQHYGFTQDLFSLLRGAGVKLESVLEVVREVVGDRLLEAIRIFESGEPNVYHAFLAKLLAAGAVTRIVTTNFDPHIERAGNGTAPVYVNDEGHDRRDPGAIYKIHGSVSTPESIVAVLSRVATGLGPAKKKLMLETLAGLCVVIGWSDDDIDLTPVFLEEPVGQLLWFVYEPGNNECIDFRNATQAVDSRRLHPRIVRILERRGGIAVFCDPLAFFLDLWTDLQQILGVPPSRSQTTERWSDRQLRAWAQSLASSERLMILASLLILVARWQPARTVLEDLLAITPASADYGVFNRLGACCTKLYDWDAAFDYFERHLRHRGYAPSIEALLEQRPVFDPWLAPLYGNLGHLFDSLERDAESLLCHSLDVEVSKLFELPDRCAAQVNYAKQLWMLGQIESARTQARDALEVAQEHGMLAVAQRATVVLARCALIEGRWREARETIESAIEIARLIGEPEVLASTIVNLVACFVTINEPETAREFVERGLEIAREHGLRQIEAELLVSSGYLYKDLAWSNLTTDSELANELLQKSLDEFDRSLTISRDLDQERIVSTALTGKGLVFYLQKRPNEALRILAESLTIRTRLRDEGGRANILDNMGIVAMKLRQTDDAAGFLEESLSIFDKRGDRVGRCQVLHDMAGVHFIRAKDALANGNRPKALFEGSRADAFLEQSLELAYELSLNAKIRQAEMSRRTLYGFLKGVAG